MKNTLLLTILISTLIACDGGGMAENINHSGLKISAADIEKLVNAKIYFAHQSVGYNILDGIRDVLGKYDETLNIVETTDVSKLTGSFFAHSSIGENTRPITKITEFYNNMNNGMGQSVDIAFLKLCYVDINSETDVDSLFKEYQSIFNKLKLQYPQITFIHFTDPLVAQQTGLKAFIKKILGRQLSGVEDNLRRQEYNELLRAAYSGKEPLFDIAEIESTKPDGSRNVHSLNGKKYFSMVPEYTSDGGHLNVDGRDQIAEKLIKFISELRVK